jgi:hypothetical protein
MGVHVFMAKGGLWGPETFLTSSCQSASTSYAWDCMIRNTWRRTAFRGTNGNVEIGRTIGPCSILPVSRSAASTKSLAVRRMADGIGVFYSCATAAWETAGTDLRRRAVRRGKPARRAYRKRRAINVPHGEACGAISKGAWRFRRPWRGSLRGER